MGTLFTSDHGWQPPPPPLLARWSGQGSCRATTTTGRPPPPPAPVVRKNRNGGVRRRRRRYCNGRRGCLLSLHWGVIMLLVHLFAGPSLVFVGPRNCTTSNIATLRGHDWLESRGIQCLLHNLHVHAAQYCLDERPVA